MTTTANLLVELFVEELPPKALKKLGESFAQGLADSLRAQGLATEHSAVTPFASPRRLGAHMSAVLSAAPDKAVSQKLMPASVALATDGTPTPALLKKLASLGADASVLPALKRQMDGKAEALFYDSVAPGATLAQGLQKALDESIAKLPIPKVMTYQLENGAQPGWTSVEFVRPAHGLVALHGADLVPVSALGLQAGRETHGHRFEAAMDPVVLQHADGYAEQLRDQGAVIASFAQRRGEIARQLQHAASQQGLTPIDDDPLLDEVTALVERPNVLLGRFEEAFLEVPQECLILTMKANQKYFPLLDAAGKLTNRFLLVSNISPADPSRVIEGNERVVRPRLADAKFFFDQDRKRSLASRVPELAKVVYHGTLGTQGLRVVRVRMIARAIAIKLGNSAFVESVDQAARLAKADLLTDMVGEFPELQGIMGRYYALHDGLAESVASAIEDHYRPRFSGDALPRELVGVAVALADKIETLVGLFAIGQVPTGDKDPYALRRHALGVIRMLVEWRLPIDLDELLRIPVAAFESARYDDATVEYLAADAKARGQTTFGLGYASLHISEEALRALHQFMFERLATTLRDQGAETRDVEAVLAIAPQRLAQVADRLAAVRVFAELPEAPALAAANKRVGNILKKSPEADAHVNPALLKEPAEQALHAAMQQVAPAAEAQFAAGDYTGSLQTLAALRAPVDAFFDGVMVNADEADLRLNRLGLLAQLHAAMNRVADLSKLAT